MNGYRITRTRAIELVSDGFGTYRHADDYYVRTDNLEASDLKRISQAGDVATAIPSEASHWSPLNEPEDRPMSGWGYTLLVTLGNGE